MASASCCSFLKFGQPKKWFRGYIVFGNSVKGNVYLLLWKSCFSETSSSCGQKCVCETGLFGQHMAVNLCLSLSLSRSPHFCRYAGICVHSVSLFSVHVPLYSYYIYICVVNKIFKLIYRYIDIILIFESNLQFVSVTIAFYHSSNPKFFCWTGKFKEHHFLSVHKTLFSINNHTPHVVPFWSFRFGHFSENVEK